MNTGKSLADVYRIRSDLNNEYLRRIISSIPFKNCRYPYNLQVSLFVGTRS
jgi:hypothetical protein